MTINSELKS